MFGHMSVHKSNVLLVDCINKAQSEFGYSKKNFKTWIFGYLLIVIALTGNELCKHCPRYANWEKLF